MQSFGRQHWSSGSLCHGGASLEVSSRDCSVRYSMVGLLGAAVRRCVESFQPLQPFQVHSTTSSVCLGVCLLSPSHQGRASAGLGRRVRFGPGRADGRDGEPTSACNNHLQYLCGNSNLNRWLLH